MFSYEGGWLLMQLGRPLWRLRNKEITIFIQFIFLTVIFCQLVKTLDPDPGSMNPIRNTDND